MSNFWRSSEMLLLNCKVELSLKWYQNCILSNLVGNSTFTITDTKLYVPIVTLKLKIMQNYRNYYAKDLKGQFIGTKYKIIPNKTYDENGNIRKLLDWSYQGVKKIIYSCLSGWSGWF